jgi:hypothetical protein
MTVFDTSPPPQQAAVKLLIAAAPDTRPLLEEHMKTYGELLPTVLFAEVAKWVTGSLPRTSDFDVVPAAIEVMEYLLVAGADDVKDLVVTGFLEGLPPGSEEDEKFMRSLGPSLRHELMRLAGTVCSRSRAGRRSG